MKRMLGYVLAGVGVVALLTGGYNVMTGQSRAVLYGPITSMTGALAGVAFLTVGLIFARE